MTSVDDNLRFQVAQSDRKSTRLNSSHSQISYAVFCLKKKNSASPDASLRPRIGRSSDAPLAHRQTFVAGSRAALHLQRFHSVLPGYVVADALSLGRCG